MGTEMWLINIQALIQYFLPVPEILRQSRVDTQFSAVSNDVLTRLTLSAGI